MAASRDGQRRTALISLLIAFFFFQVQQEQQMARTKMRQNTQIRAKILFLDRKQWRTGRPLSFSQRHLGLPNCWQPLQNLLWFQVREIYEWYQHD